MLLLILSFFCFGFVAWGIIFGGIASWQMLLALVLCPVFAYLFFCFLAKRLFNSW
jgi:hypothetical protein